MASSIDTQVSQRYVDFDEYIDYQLQKTRGNIKSTDLLTALAVVAVFVLAYLLLFVIGDHWLVADGFSPLARGVLLSLVGLVSASWIIWKVLWPYWRQVNRLFAAKMIEQSQPELRSTLLNLIDARSHGQNVSPHVLSAMEKRAALSISTTNVDDVVDRRPLMRACYAVLALVVLFCLYTLFTPKKVSTSIWRALFPAAAVEAPTQTVIDAVRPGDVEVIPGTRLEVLADVRGDVPERVVLHYSTADNEFVDEPIDMREVPDVPRQYRAEIIGANGEGIQQDVSYYVTAGDDRSPRFSARVYQPPSVEIVELHYAYPTYMEREPKTRPTGNVDDFEGVTVTFDTKSNVPLKSATITFHDDQGTNFQAEAVPLSATNRERTRFRGQWVLTIPEDDGIYPRYYTIECKNDKGDSDPKPARWPIRIHPDQRPEVQIVNPRERELERPANAVLPLTVAAKDDFNANSLTLWKQKNDGPPVAQATLFEGAEASLSVSTDWRLNEGPDWTIADGDKVSYWVEVQDNRTPKPGRRNSEKYSVLIKPELPEEAVQKQLEADRPPEPPKPEEQQQQDDKNASKTKPERPQDDGEAKDDPPQQPMPQEDNPEPSENGQGGEEGQESEASKSSQNGGTEKQNSKKNGNEGQPVKSDGSQDGEALESLHRHFQEPTQQPDVKNPPDKAQPNEPNKQPPGTEQTDPKDGATNPPQSNNKSSNPKPGSTGDQPEPKTNDPQEPGNKQTPGIQETQKDPADNPGQEPGTEGSKPKDPKEPSNQSTNNQTPGDDPAKSTSQPTDAGSEKTDAQKPKPGETEIDPMQPEPMPGAEQKPSEGDVPKNPAAENSDATKPKPGENPNEKPKEPKEPKNTEGHEAQGGSDQNTGQGQPSKSSDPTANNKGTGTGGEETKPRDGGSGRQAEQPLKGHEKPAQPGDDVKPRKATGNETGPGTAETDPNTDPTRAKNNVERADPEKPTVTRKREGAPEELPADQQKKPAPGEASESTDPTETKPGSNNPNPAETTKKQTDQTKNPDERPAQGSKADPNPNRKPTKQEDQPDQGDDELRGKGRPEGQRAEKPEGGENGGSKQNEQGTPGSNETGPGDTVKRPGNKEPATEPTGGQSGNERGEGSKTRPTEDTEPAPPRPGENPSDPQTEEQTQPADQPAQELPGSKKPGGTADGSDAGKPGGTEGQPSDQQNQPTQRTGEAGTHQPGQNNSTSSQPTPTTAKAAEKANLDYGRKATDLTLKQLENELSRGEVNEEWLKEMGWTEKDAANFLDRMRNQLDQRDANSPESLAKQRQFNEWLKRLKKPETQTNRRTGSTVRNQSPRDLIDARNSKPPAEFRDLFEEYQRGMAERKD